jgi:hypothetical protein
MANRAMPQKRFLRQKVERDTLTTLTTVEQDSGKLDFFEIVSEASKPIILNGHFSPVIDVSNIWL